MKNQLVVTQSKVAPHTGAWIETIAAKNAEVGEQVAPHTGAWIETLTTAVKTANCQSHPTRVRGLKLRTGELPKAKLVAPHTGAWIETRLAYHSFGRTHVAPHTGAWIETLVMRLKPTAPSASHPTRVRGLKHHLTTGWTPDSRRTPHGCVD